MKIYFFITVVLQKKLILYYLVHIVEEIKWVFVYYTVMTHATSLNRPVSRDIRIMIRLKVSSLATKGCSNKPSYELMSTIFLDCVDRRSGI